MNTDFWFLDIETTGLDPAKDKIVELTYAHESKPGKIHSRTLYFGVTEVPDFINKLIGFDERGIAGKRSSDADIYEFLALTERRTMVSANPKFDAGFLEANDLFRFKYRTLDIESYCMAKLNLDFVPGMSDIYDILTTRGYSLTKPEHTSESDVRCLAEAYFILRGL